MLLELDCYDWAMAFKEGSSNIMPCPPTEDIDNQSVILPSDVEIIIRIREGENDERDWLLLGILKGGDYIFLRAGCDYTGWDCQASGSIELGKSLKQVMQYGMTEEEIVAIGLGEFHKLLKKIGFLPP